jgi:hypothetical protein
VRAFADPALEAEAPSSAVVQASPPLGVRAQTPAAPDERKNPFARVTPPDDPTGGAYTTPTLLFIPAGAVPTWNVRVIASLDMQTPTAADKLAAGTSVGFLPGIGGELGLPGGLTFGAGTVWAGGDTGNLAGGISPYFQLRLHIVGDTTTGRGFQLGSSVTYKFVGFGSSQGAEGQDPGEMEFAVSAQYRQRLYEVGLQGVIGKDFATTDADGEMHAYAVVRPISQLALGAATQLRLSLVKQTDEPEYDVIGGGIASLTLGRWQIAGLGGESTVNLNQGTQARFGALVEVFGTARF